MPGLAPRRCVLQLAAIAGLEEREALAIMAAAPVALFRGMALAEATRWQMRLELAGIASTIQAEPISSTPP